MENIKATRHTNQPRVTVTPIQLCSTTTQKILETLEITGAGGKRGNYSSKSKEPGDSIDYRGKWKTWRPLVNMQQSGDHRSKMENMETTHLTIFYSDDPGEHGDNKSHLSPHPPTRAATIYLLKLKIKSIFGSPVA